MLWFAFLPAILIALLFDAGHLSFASAFGLVTGASLMVLPSIPAWAASKVARRFPVFPAERVMQISVASLVLPPLMFALVRLAPVFPAPAAWLLPAVIGFGVVAGSVLLWAVRRARTWISQPLALTALVAATLVTLGLIALHIAESTLALFRPGTAPLHLVFFVGTWALGLIVWGLWTLGANELEPRLDRKPAFVIGGLAIVIGIVLVVADRRILADLYPAAHVGLSWAGVTCIASGLSILGQQVRPAWSTKGLFALVILALLSIVFLVRVGSLSAGVRGELALVPTGKNLAFLFPAGGAANRKSRPPLPVHPLLKVDQHLADGGPPKKLNMLLITVDALRGDEVDQRMPVANAMAQRGVRFERAYTQGTRTALAMGGLMLGRECANIDWKLWLYLGGKLKDPDTTTPAEMKALNGHFAYSTVPKVPRDRLLSARLKKVGYRTMATPFAGENEFFRRGGYYDFAFDSFEDRSEEKWKLPTSAQIANVAIHQLESHGDGPWFQWIHFYDPHEAGATRAKYDAMSLEVDKALGAILESLKKQGLEDNTLVVLTADHGEALGEHGNKGHASSIFDEQAHVPIVMYYPGIKSASFSQPVALIDINATLLVAAGADLSEIDGVNLWPLIQNGVYPENRPIFVELHRYYSNKKTRTTDLMGVVLGQQKLIRDRLKGAEMLFDLGPDPKEENNLLSHPPPGAEVLGPVLDSYLDRAERAHPLP